MGHLWGRGDWWKVYWLPLMKVLHPQPLTRVQHFSMWPKGYTKQPGQQINPMITHFCCLVWGTKVYQVPPSFRKPSQDPVDFLSSTFTERLVHSRMSHFFTIKDPLQFPSWPSMMSGRHLYLPRKLRLKPFSSFVNQSIENANPISWFVEITSKLRVSWLVSLYIKWRTE